LQENVPVKVTALPARIVRHVNTAKKMAVFVVRVNQVKRNKSKKYKSKKISFYGK